MNKILRTMTTRCLWKMKRNIKETLLNVTFFGGNWINSNLFCLFYHKIAHRRCPRLFIDQLERAEMMRKMIMVANLCGSTGNCSEELIISPREHSFKENLRQTSQKRILFVFGGIKTKMNEYNGAAKIKKNEGGNLLDKGREKEKLVPFPTY
jgi:hypothetical protein